MMYGGLNREQSSDAMWVSPHPERLKYATLRPGYKKGDKLLTANYRPISPLTSFSKIFVKLIYSRLYKHICTNNILVKEQYGFRINNATEAASYDVVNPYPTAFPYGNGIVLHFYQQQESSMTKTVHKVINKGLKTYV